MHQITGQDLLELTEDEIKNEIGVKIITDRK